MSLMLSMRIHKIWMYSFGLISILLVVTNCTVRDTSNLDKKAYTDDDPAFREKYTVKFGEEEKPIRYGYHYIVSTIPEGYRVRVFQPDKKILTEIKTYSTPDLTLLNGSFQSYWDDGSIRAQGNYQDGQKHGMWLESEPGRGKSALGLYEGESKEGEWTQLDTNGLIESIYTWKNGKLDGKFLLLDSTGQKINEGLYRSDSLVTELVKQTTIIKPSLQSCADKFSGDLNACTAASFDSTIYANLKYPSSARERKIEGTAIVQWDVLADGTASHLRVPQGLCDEIQSECIRVFQNIGKWKPAYQDGQPIKFTMSSPITFQLK
jgi:hypothetical protein